MRVVCLAIVLVAGCEPSIADRSYYCGPNRSCPPMQACDEPTYTCDDPARARSFACPSEDAEPNDDVSTAIDLGATTCGDILASQRAGCLAEAGDTDVFVFRHEQPCELGNDAIVAMNFPAAFAPIALEVTNADGDVVAVGEVCTISNDTSGRTRLCAEITLEPGEYYVSATIGAADDCDGECRYNEYELDIALLL